MDLTELLSKGGLFEQLANQYDVDTNKVEGVVKNGLPKLSEAINKNASSEQGLESFMKALKDHKDDDVDTMLTDVNKVDAEDGEKILGHIFGEEKPAVEHEISQVAGINPQAVGGILKILAPILLGLLGNSALKAKKKPSTEEAEVAEATEGGLGGILDSFLGKDSNVTQMASSFLDKDKDGSIFDDVLGKLFGK